MQLEAARVVLRPRSSLELLDLAWRFLQSNGRPLIRTLSWWVLVPLWSLTVTLRFGFQLPWEAVWIIALAIAAPCEGLFVLAASKLMFSQDVTAREVLRSYAARFASHVVALSLCAMMLAVAGMLYWLIFPVFLVVAIISHIHETSLLEHANPLGAVGRSAGLAKGNLAGTFWFQVLAYVHVAGFILLFEMVGNEAIVDFVLQLGAPLGKLDWGGSAIALAGLFASIPFTGTLRFLAYINRRTRLDGWDVQVRCLAVVAAARSSPQQHPQHPQQQQGHPQ